MPAKISDLKHGYMKFRETYFDGQNDFYKNLVEQGQQPKYLVVACSDSRVDPSLILNCKPGDLFVIRNVANLVPPYEIDTHYHGTSAALEFGICGLGIQDIILLGHSQCGGILSLLTQEDELNNVKNSNTTNPSDKEPNNGSFIAKWMELAQVPCHSVLCEKSLHSPQESADLCAKSALLGSLNNLHTFPWIIERVQAGTLFIHVWFFELTSGMIYSYNNQLKTFEPFITMVD